jgi:hypothetical protein
MLISESCVKNLMLDDFKRDNFRTAGDSQTSCDTDLNEVGLMESPPDAYNIGEVLFPDLATLEAESCTSIRQQYVLLTTQQRNGLNTLNIASSSLHLRTRCVYYQARPAIVAVLLASCWAGVGMPTGFRSSSDSMLL